MKYIKTFNEGISNFPQYLKGHIVLWADNLNDENLVKSLAKRHGYEYVEEVHPNGYLIKTPIGEEEKVGKILVDKYPDIFVSGYERFDINFKTTYKKLEKVSDYVNNLLDSFGSYDKDWDDKIDLAIKMLEDLKYLNK